MNKLERGKISGVVKESANLNLILVDGLYAVSYLVSKLRSIYVEGSLPGHGPAILVGNHISNLDPFIMGFIAWRDAKRHIRVVAKHTLFDTTSREIKDVEERIGRESFPDNAPKLLRHAAVYVTKSLDAIPANRGARINRTLVEEVRKTLQNHALLGIFMNELRDLNQDILIASHAPAMIASRFPAVPIVPIGFSGSEVKNIIFTREPIKVGIGQAFTYQEFKQSKPDIDYGQMTEIICDRIDKLVEPKYKQH